MGERGLPELPEGRCEMTGEANTALLEGERRKDRQLATLGARRDAIVTRARRAFIRQLFDAGTATADDIRAAVELPAGIDPRCLGSVPGPLATAGIIRRGDFVKSTRPERHACYIARWELADADTARRWLADHPDPPDPAPDVTPHDVAAGPTLFDVDQKPATPTVDAVGVGQETMRDELRESQDHYTADPPRAARAEPAGCRVRGRHFR
jgi:hypothetical protein